MIYIKQLFQSQKHLPKLRQHSKMVNHFLSISSIFCIVRTIRFCSNFTSMWFKYLSNNVWSDFRLSMSASAMVLHIEYSIGKPIFGENLPLKLFRATVANADLKSLKSLHTFLKKMFVLLAIEI